MSRRMIKNKHKSTVQELGDVSDGLLGTLVERAVEFELLAANIPNELDEGKELRILLKKASGVIRERVENYMLARW